MIIWVNGEGLLSSKDELDSIGDAFPTHEQPIHYCDLEVL